MLLHLNKEWKGDYTLKIELSHDGHILAIVLDIDDDDGLKSFGRSKLKMVDLGAIDASALRPTQDPNPWHFIVVTCISKVAAIRKFSSALRSRMPLMQSAGRLMIKWNQRWEGETIAFDVWNDEAASELENGDESSDGENSGEEGSGRADDEGSSGESDDEESSGITSDRTSEGEMDVYSDEDSTSEEEMDIDRDEGGASEEEMDSDYDESAP